MSMFLSPIMRFLIKVSLELVPFSNINITVLFLVPFLGVPAQMYILGPNLLHDEATFRLLITYLWRNKEVLRSVFFTSSIYNHFKHSAFIDWVHSLNHDNNNDYIKFIIRYKIK